MFRGRSDGKGGGSERRPSGQQKGKNRQSSARAAARQARRKDAGDRVRTERGRVERAQDPRSSETGKKIRRIESGSGPTRQADPTDIGGPPSRPPTRRPIGRSDSPGGQSVPGGLVNRGSLPPLQPTDDIPRIPVDAVEPDETVTIAANGDGVFGQDPGAEDNADHPLRAVPVIDQTVAGDADRPARSETSPAIRYELDDIQAEIRASSAESGYQEAGGQGRQIPSALPDFDQVDVDADADVDGPQEIATDVRHRADSSVEDSMDAVADDGLPKAGDYAAVGATAMTGDVASSMAGRDQYGTANRRPNQALTSAGRRQGPPADATGQMAHDPAPTAGFGDPRAGGGAPPRRSDPGRGRGSERRDRPQDTEFKLADNRPRRKPKEPNRFLLAFGLGAILLLGAAAAWYFTRDTEPESIAANDAEAVSTESTVGESDPATPEATVATEPVVSEPTLFFDAAVSGPLQQGETYSIDLVGEPEGSLLQVVVDDIPQGTPEVLLPDLILPPGRHNLYIQITNGAEVTQSTPIELYVLGDAPPEGFRANLSSVDVQTEGWAEAIRQFDEYRAAGHESLQLLPISPGYWNLFIGGLGEDRSVAQTYCESFSLAVPDQCFPTYYEPSAADSTATEADEDADADAMTDEGTTSTTAAGG